MESLREEVNDMELKYWEKNENFWRLMFSCCIGFVSFVTPFLLDGKMPMERLRWMRYSVVCGCFCAVAIVPLLRRSIRFYHNLWKSGQKMMRGKSPIKEVVLPIRTYIENLAIAIAGLSAVAAGVFLAMALFG